MAKNADLGAAKTAKKDEFYTQLTDIEKEMRYYRKHFQGKTVLCNCDDPFESNFFKYFALNFNRLGLKKLIATCYYSSPIAGQQLQYGCDANGQMTFYFEDKGAEENKSKRPYKAVVTQVYDKMGDGGVDMLDVAELFRTGENELVELEGDGDFRSPECLDLLDESDIVVTNPPFSLFREYAQTLDISGTGIMGYITIPKISVELPIYHGTDEGVLQVAAGHLEGSSLPVGGAGTHAVISAHRGLPSAKLFTNLDELEVGDRFTITVLNRVLTYEVDQISIVLPTEIDQLLPTEGMDYVTLMTCTPYGINTHRLLVRGKRVETTESQKHIRVAADAFRIEPIIVAPILAIPMLLAALVGVLVAPHLRKRSKRRRK